MKVQEHRRMCNTYKNSEYEELLLIEMKKMVKKFSNILSLRS